MKCAMFYGKHDLRIEDKPMPTLKPADVLVQVKICGVCGTDVHIYEGDPGAADVPPMTVIGHEFSGVVAGVGSDVSEWKIGDRVCVDPNRYCGECIYCRDGQAHFCSNMIGYGTTVDGGFAEYCAVDQSQLYKLGDNTSFEAGAMTEPAACCLHGIDLCEIKPGQQVVVIGGGMIGLLMVQLAKLAGASKVALLELVAAKREMGSKLGADICIDPAAENPAEALKAAGMDWINTVIECVGLPSTVEMAIELAGPKATVMIFGLTKPDDAISFKPFRAFQKELTLKTSFINPYTHRRALSLIDSGRLDVSSMVYSVSPLEKLPDILSDAALRAKGKYLISAEAK